MSDNQFVRDTCMLIRHDAVAYHEDGWKKKAAMALGGAAAIGAAGYLGGTKKGRGQVRQAAGYVKRKTGDVIGAVGRHVEGNAKSQKGAMFGRRMRNVGYKMSPSQRNAV
jgi:hypothetical protein